eukprot:gene53604-biopygen6991
MISPVDFIPIAEESGMIVQLGEWAIREACAQAASWPGELSVAVNISPRQLLADGLNSCVVQALAASGLPAARLELEITESVFIGDVERTLKLLHSMQSLGVRIALDDFGTGYASILSLLKLTPRRLKIDRQLILPILDSPTEKRLVESIIDIGTSLGIEVIAEGVETLEHARMLQELGCHGLQGYAFARPMSANDLATFVFERRWQAA